MIMTREHYMRAVEGVGGAAEGIKFAAVILLLIFLVNSLLVLVGDEGKRDLPVKSYAAYMIMYFFYRIAEI